MKKRILVASVLLLAAGASLGIALNSLEGVNKKMKLTSNSQTTMEVLEPSPTPDPSPTPEVQLEPTSTPEPTNPAAPVLTLVSDTLELTKGQPFDVVAQVADITDDNDDRYALFRRIQVKGVFDLNTPGEYVLEYYATDSDGNESPRRQLKLTVKAAQ